MNASRISCLGGFFGFMLFIGIGHCPASVKATVPTTQKAIEPTAQLAPGKTPGTFHLVYHGRAQFSMPGHCALIVTISERYHPDITALQFDDAKEFTAEADLRPGSYILNVAPAEPKNAEYWPSEWQTIQIDKTGHLYEPRPWIAETAGVFVLERRMTGVSPANGVIADAKQPVLKWPAIAGATHYRGDYRGGGKMKWFDVDEIQYVIGGGLDAGEWCGWRVVALDVNDKVLARGAGRFLGHGTDQATIEKMRAARGGTCGLPPSPGRAYLGIQPLPIQVPKDAATPMEDERGSGQVLQDQASGFIPGILVVQVFPGSPAVDADLHIYDVITAVDGQPVPSEDGLGDFRTFTEQLVAMEPGREINLTVRRFPRLLTLHATIGRYPGAGATTQPTTSPAVAVRSPAPAAPKEDAAAQQPDARAVWTTVESGTPAKYPFHVQADADIPLLSTKQGLISNWVTCMAELPHGGVAFGTREGLSIWDGSEIRNYTGPSFSGQRGGTIDGNSGLPANEIQDLLCDSHGRLWAATMYGVCRIDTAPPGTWRVLQNPERNAFARRGMDEIHDVQKIFETSDGTIVLGARASAIALIDPKTDTPMLIHGDGEMNHWITGIAEDRQHRLWFSVYGVGVLRYDGAKVEQIRGPWIVGNDLRGVCIDGAGTIWITLGESGLGALHADGTTERVNPDQLAGGYVHSVSTDRAGRVWATCDFGFAVHDPDDAQGKNKPWKFFGGEGNRMWYVLNTSDGSSWVSSAGIFRTRNLQLTTTNPRAAAIDRVKRDIEKAYPKVKVDRSTAVGPAGVVVTVAGEQLLRFDGKKWEDIGQRFGNPMVYRLRTDSKGTIWIATSGAGLIGLDPAGGVRRFNNEPELALSVIYDLDETPDGTLYAGTQHGVYRLRGDTWEQVPSKLFQVGQVLADRRGRVWMIEVTYNNLYVYDGNRFREVKEQTALSDEQLEWGSLRLDDAGNVLVDIPPRPSKGVPKRTFRWDAAAVGKIGQPVEVK